ncbi:MAG: hypothetical protein ABI600_04650, partial [Luteolibacter sp.]
MKPSIQSKARQRGFALIVTLSLMILLTVVAVGLLSLSAISLRTASAAEVNGRAYANARMAMMMALGELQNHTGDDRRITADASIFTTAVQSHMVGAWTSWSPNLAVTPDQAGPDYSKEKTAHFRSWLSSSPDPAASKDPNWADKALGSDAVRLFSNSRDGFALSAQRVPIANGSFAWAVSQEGTKAKVNIAGPDASPTTGNIGLQAQARPSLSQSKSLKDLTDGWNKRASRLLSFNQIQLDKDLCPDPTAFRAEGGSYTPHSQGLLADVVKGGLKTDLNLGFEMSDSDFALDSWGATKNPFRSVGTNSGVVSPSTYKGQQPLFKPLTDNPIVANTLSYSPATLDNRFFAAGVPTFDHLRSFYRIPRHLYGGSSPVVAERGAGHVAIKVAAASSGSYLSPSNPPTAAESKLAIRPVLDRVVYLLGSALGADGEVRLIMTPAISLWNPYNVALESEGAVAFQWMDAPFRVNWYFKNAAGTSKKYGPLSAIMAKQFSGQGRSINPYFFCEITADGNGNISKPIHFEPGEVRLFVPASNTPVDFVRKGSNAQRTVRLRAVNDISEMNIKGGIAIPMKPGNSAEGFSYVVQPNDETQTTFQAFGNGNYNYFVSLEDAARIKNPADSTRGEAIGEVQSVKFLSSEDEVKSAYYSVAELKNGTQPF